jgi:tetratricopeptide (TPR) repeat protein
VSHTEVDDILFHYQLGDDYYKRGLFVEAVGEYQKALTLNPNYADIRNHLGIAYSAQGLIAEAIREFQYALDINPRFVDAMLNLGITLRDSGNHAEANKMFADVLKIEPVNPTAHQYLQANAHQHAA